MEILKNIYIINESTDSLICQWIADEIYIHILCSSADVTSQTTHNNTAFDGNMAAQLPFWNRFEHYILAKPCAGIGTAIALLLNAG